jgi:hypothetical protein
MFKTMGVLTAIAILVLTVTLHAKTAAPAGTPKTGTSVQAMASPSPAVAEAWGNTVCPVMGKVMKKGKAKVVALPNGKRINVCCGYCSKEVKKNPDKYEAWQY